MHRLDDFIIQLESDLTDSEIAAGIGNGDIKKPDWLIVNESNDHIKISDHDDLGFYYIFYY